MTASSSGSRGAEVDRERDRAASRLKLGAALAEQAHVGVAEAVDRLQLVADREEVVAVERPEDRELACVRVLELVDHQQLEALRPGPANALPLAQQLAREQLEVVEVGGAALLLGVCVGGAEATEQLVDERARLPRAPLELRAIAGVAQGQPRPALPAAAQLGVDALDHAPCAVDAVGREQVDRLAAPVGEEFPHGGGERSLAQAAGEALVEDREVRRQPRGERMGAQQARAEGVERAHERGLGVARSRTVAELEQTLAHARAQLARGALGERDREDARRRGAVLANGAHEALDEHAGLAAARRRRTSSGSPRRATACSCCSVSARRARRPRRP